MSHSSAKVSPAARLRLLIPLVVIEAEMSTITPPCDSGKPIASGFGVNTACVPPKGATLAVLGSEQASSMSMSSCSARSI
ncbi:hypothetical protein D3C72_2429690 [compost metagenome]